MIQNNFENFGHTSFLISCSEDDNILEKNSENPTSKI